MKICKTCGKEKPLTDFAKSGKYYKPHCRPCRLAYHKKYNKTNAHKIYQANVKRKYGLSWEEHEKLKIEQGNCCAICKRKLKLVVDHDHEFGYHRGLLCNGCNVGMSIFDKYYEEALKYKEKWEV